MHQMTLMRMVVLAELALGLAVAGCVASPAFTPETILSSTPAIIRTRPTSTMTPKATKTQVLPSPTSLPTSTITPTTTPAVPPEEILNLLKTNGGCLLPCWWDIRPGETTIEAVKGFTDQFGDLAIHVLLDDIGNFRIRVPDGSAQPKIDVAYGPLQGDKVEWLRVSPILYYKNNAGEYEISDRQDDPQYREYYSAYTIDAVLATYGKPDVMLLNGDMVNTPGLPWVYALTLVYPEKGIWIEYFGKMGGETYFGICPMQTSITLSLWEPKKYASVEEVLSSSLPVGAWGLGLGKLSTLEEKTNLTVDEFYETFKNADYDTCFKSPTERWP